MLQLFSPLGKLFQGLALEDEASGGAFNTKDDSEIAFTELDLEVYLLKVENALCGLFLGKVSFRFVVKQHTVSKDEESSLPHTEEVWTLLLHHSLKVILIREGVVHLRRSRQAFYVNFEEPITLSFVILLLACIIIQQGHAIHDLMLDLRLVIRVVSNQV